MSLSLGIQGFIEGFREPNKSWTARNFSGSPAHRTHRIQQWERGARTGSLLGKVLRSRKLWLSVACVLFAMTTITLRDVIEENHCGVTMSKIVEGRAFRCE